jgi:anti-anti-sigma factor
MPVDLFREAAAAAASGNTGAIVDLEGVDYLDASSLQILLALEAAQRASSLPLRLTNASPTLRRWFEYAGATQVFQFA